MLVAWLITPGISVLPGGSFTFSHTRHSCSWRGLAASKLIAADLDPQHQVDDVLERHVEGVRARSSCPSRCDSACAPPGCRSARG